MMTGHLIKRCLMMRRRKQSKLSNKDDWSITVQAGVAYKFGYKKKPVI